VCVEQIILDTSRDSITVLEFYAVRSQAVAHIIDLRFVFVLEGYAVLTARAYDFVRQFANVPIIDDDGQVGKG
jgi:hypothetical protein